MKNSALFKDLDLLPSLQATLTEKGLVKLTEIQSKTIAPLLLGESIVGVAETGTAANLMVYLT